MPYSVALNILSHEKPVIVGWAFMAFMFKDSIVSSYGEPQLMVSVFHECSASQDSQGSGGPAPSGFIPPQPLYLAV